MNTVDVPLANIYYLLCYAWERSFTPDEVDTAGEVCRRPVDLFAKLFIEELERIIKRGLERGYETRFETRAAPAGKLLLGHSLATGALPKKRIVCERDELTHDIASNRVLAATLASLIAEPELDARLRAELGRLSRRFPAVEPIRRGVDDPHRILVHRNNRTYRFALDLCALILDQLAPLDGGAGERFRDFSGDSRIMGLVFESFVRRYLEREQTHIEIETARGLAWQVRGDPASLSVFPRLETDIRLRRGAQRTVIETKFYRTPLSSHYGARKLRSEHVAQLYVYLENLRARYPNSPPPAGVLLYAQVLDPLRFDYEIKDYRMVVRSLDLGRPWREIGSQLVALAQECASFV